MYRFCDELQLHVTSSSSTRGLDGGIAGGNNTSRGTSTCFVKTSSDLDICDASSASDRALESARLLLRDLSIVIDPRSTDSTLQFRAVSPDERWKEENQRSKKRFKRAFKKIKGLSLMKRLKSKLSSKKKSGGGMLLRLAAAAKKSSDKEKKEDEESPSLLRLLSSSSISSTSSTLGEDEDLTEETTLFRKSAKLLLCVRFDSSHL